MGAKLVALDERKHKKTEEQKSAAYQIKPGEVVGRRYHVNFVELSDHHLDRMRKEREDGREQRENSRPSDVPEPSRAGRENGDRLKRDKAIRSHHETIDSTAGTEHALPYSDLTEAHDEEHSQDRQQERQSTEPCVESIRAENIREQAHFNYLTRLAWPAPNGRNQPFVARKNGWIVESI